MPHLRLFSTFLRFSLFLLTGALCSVPAVAVVTLPALISDHAVLQRSAKTAVFGMANPGEKVTATLGNVSGQNTAGQGGKWRIELDLSKSWAGPLRPRSPRHQQDNRVRCPRR